MTLRRRAACALVVAALLAVPPHEAVAVESGRDLAKYCQALQKGIRGSGRQIRIPNTKESLLCWGYMQAMQDLSVLTDEQGRPIIGTCPPEDATTLQLIESFLTYARSHPDALRAKAAVAVVTALQDAYPCLSGDVKN
jgi:Rap1a immunity proteins